MMNAKDVSDYNEAMLLGIASWLGKWMNNQLTVKFLSIKGLHQILKKKQNRDQSIAIYCKACFHEMETTK